MKKLFGIILASFLTISTAFAYQIQAGTGTQRLERGTIIELEMAEPITTRDFTTGDLFTATVVENVKQNKKTILPTGTFVRGSIGEVKPAKRLSRAAKVAFTFDHIVTPQGRQLPMRAALCSYFKITPEGFVTSGGNYGTAMKHNVEKSGEYIQKATQWGVNSGEKLFAGAQILTVPVGVAGGFIYGAGYLVFESIADLIRKGDEVIINQGQRFNIMLLDYLDVPVN